MKFFLIIIILSGGIPYVLSLVHPINKTTTLKTINQNIQVVPPKSIYESKKKYMLWEKGMVLDSLINENQSYQEQLKLMDSNSLTYTFNTHRKRSKY